MTATIWTECGQFKVGVLTRCTKCPGPPAVDEGTGFYFSDGVIERADNLLEAVGADRIHRRSVRWAKWGWAILLAMALLAGLCVKALN